MEAHYRRHRRHPLSRPVPHNGLVLVLIGHDQQLLSLRSVKYRLGDHQ